MFFLRINFFYRIASCYYLFLFVYIKLPVVIVVDVIGIPTKPRHVVVDTGLWGSQFVQNSCAI